MNRVLFCVLGRTASGKDTLSTEICKQFNLNKLISYTTRAPRSEFEDTHIFATEADFYNFAANGQIAASTKIGEYYYWSTIEQLKAADIYVTDYIGLKQIKSHNLLDVKIVTIYIKAPEDERHKRAYMRNPDVDAYWTRNAAEKEQFDELEELQDWDYLIYNNRFADGCKHFEEIITYERNKNNVL